MENNPNITTYKLMQVIGISKGYVEKIIRKLKQKKYIERVGSNKTGHWKVLK